MYELKLKLLEDSININFCNFKQLFLDIPGKVHTMKGQKKKQTDKLYLIKIKTFVFPREKMTCRM